MFFDTQFVGSVKVSKDHAALTMDFPFRPGEEVDLSSLPDLVLSSLSSTRPVYARRARDLMLVYDDAQTVLTMKPNFHALLECQDFIIVTAPSICSQYDFISRFFCTADGLLEDPVTGSAHCTLAPYWAERLNKQRLRAYQASNRGRVLDLELQKERLYITGEAVTIIEGTLRLDHSLR